MNTSTTATRRAVLVGTAAVAGAAMLPAIPAAETLAPACQIDRAAFASRLHQWALHVPEMGSRIDALLANVEWVLSGDDDNGTGALLEARQLCEDRSGRDLSLDWLVGGEGEYPNGKPIRMWLNDPLEETPPDEAHVRLVRLCSQIESRHHAEPIIVALSMAMETMVARDYARCREWMGYAFQQAGVVIEQW